jgi:broad specificity phosphatase PhoE
MPILFYVARHGLTSEDLPGREKVTGWKDIPLNVEGKAQAAKLGRFLKSKGITKIISSDTKRAFDTATIIGEIINVPVTATEKLRSWNMGAIQGMFSEAAKPFLEFFEKNPTLKPPKGEPFWSFFRRFKGAFWGIVAFIRKFPQSRILVLTHSQDLDLIEWLRDGVEPGEKFEFGEGLPAGGACEVRVYEDGSITKRKIFGKGREAGG